MIKWLARLIEPGNEWVPPRTGRAVQEEAESIISEAPNTGQRSEIQERAGTTERKCVCVCVCEREKEMFHTATRGQWELILLLSSPLPSLAVLAVGWWIHCFLKFVCKHGLYSLLSYLLGPRFSVFSSLFHHTRCLFFSFISSSLLFLLFLLKSIHSFVYFCVSDAVTRSLSRATSPPIINVCWLCVCVCYVHACTMSSYVLPLVYARPLFSSSPPSLSGPTFVSPPPPPPLPPLCRLSDRTPL